MPREVWKAVETKAGEVGVAEIEGRGEERRSKKETRRKRAEEKEKNKGSKEGSRRIRNIRWRGSSSKIGRGGKKAGSRTF